MTNPAMFGRGLPEEGGLPWPDDYAEELDQDAQSWATAMAKQLTRWLSGAPD